MQCAVQTHSMIAVVETTHTTKQCNTPTFQTLIHVLNMKFEVLVAVTMKGYAFLECDAVQAVFQRDMLPPTSG
jgi:hypothetical protein